MDLENIPGLATLVDMLHNVGMEFDKHIPIPGPSRETYPFGQMSVGDSFMVVDATWIKNIRSAAYMHSRRHPGVKFTVRKYGDGWRIWRTA